MQRHGQLACVECSLLTDDELAQMRPPMSANGTHAPDTGLPLKGQAPAQCCPQCGCPDLMDGLTYRKCAQCSWRDGPLPQEILGPAQAEKKVLEV